MKTISSCKDTFIIFSIFIGVCLITCVQPEATFDPKILKKGYDQVKKGKYLDNVNKTKIGDVTEISFLGCIEGCITRRRCSSVNYFKRSRFCHFNFGTGQVSDLKSDRTDALYTNVSAEIWDQRLVGSCVDHKCYLNQMCKRLPLGKMECVISDCGEQPILVANSTYELPDGISIGNRVFYQCNHGYKSSEIERKMFGYCRPNGNWSTPKFKCSLEYCGAPIPVDNADAMNNQNYSFGMSVDYRCNSKSNMLSKDGIKKSSIVCEAGGKWSKPKFICAEAVESCDVMVSRYTTYTFPDGAYYITLGDLTRPVYCNISAGKWTVIEFRTAPESPHGIFDKTYSEYAAGFGNPFNYEQYWIGNDYLAALTNKHSHEIHVEIGYTAGSVFGRCGHFVVSPATEGFKLTLNNPGTAAICNDFSHDNGKPFYGHTGDRCPNHKRFFGDTLCGGWWQGLSMCLNCYLRDGRVKIQQNPDKSGSWSLMMIRQT